MSDRVQRAKANLVSFSSVHQKGPPLNSKGANGSREYGKGPASRAPTRTEKERHSVGSRAKATSPTTINHVPASYSRFSPQPAGCRIRAIFRHTAALAIVG